MKPSPISPTVDLNKDGVQHGHLKLPYSHDTSAWGSIMLPITVIKNGDGPTALITGGNHGDEYEGPTAIFKLATTLKAEDISGRVILVPAMNYPAFQAGTRTSPIDSGNMNRLFPGKPDGTVTEKIADYFQRHLLPEADLVLDIHSGGKTLDFVPFAAIHELPDKAQQEACAAAMRAFSAPYSMTLLELDSVGMYDTAAENLGKIFVSTELGGGGSTTKETIEIADRGIRNILCHMNILSDEPDLKESISLDMPGGECFTTATTSGLIEFSVDLGDPVKKGDVIARIYDIHHTGIEPVEYSAELDGILASRHFPGLVNIGDNIAVVAVTQ